MAGDRPIGISTSRKAEKGKKSENFGTGYPGLKQMTLVDQAKIE